MIAIYIECRYLPPAGDGSRETVAFYLHPGYGVTALEAHDRVLDAMRRRERLHLVDASGERWPICRETVRAFCVVDVDVATAHVW